MYLIILFSGTHDVYKANVNFGEVDNEIVIVSEYLQDSIAQGFFVIVYSTNHTLYRVAHRNDSEPSTTLTVSGLGNNVYRLAVYDLTDNNTYNFLQPEDGTQGPAVLPDEVIEMNDGNQGKYMHKW